MVKAALIGGEKDSYLRAIVSDSIVFLAFESIWIEDYAYYFLQKYV